jgi:hypothetical protein
MMRKVINEMLLIFIYSGQTEACVDLVGVFFVVLHRNRHHASVLTPYRVVVLFKINISLYSLPNSRAIVEIANIAIEICSIISRNGLIIIF